jgi:hypothetical protein
MAQDYLITINYGQHERTVFDEAGGPRSRDSHTCQYLAVIANLNGPTTVIREKSKHILTITGGVQTVSWPLPPKSPVRSERIMPFYKRASLVPKTLKSHHQVLLCWTPRTNNKLSHAPARQAFRHGQPDIIYPNMTINKDNISTGYIPIPSPPVIIR